MNHILKRSVAKTCQETLNLSLKHVKRHWTCQLPCYGSVAPRSRLKLSPFRILYGRPLQVCAQAGESINAKDLAVANHIKTVGAIYSWVYLQQVCPSNRSRREFHRHCPLEKGQPICLIVSKEIAPAFSICIKLEPKPQVQLRIRQETAKRFHQV